MPPQQHLRTPGISSGAACISCISFEIQGLFENTQLASVHHKFFLNFNQRFSVDETLSILLVA